MALAKIASGDIVVLLSVETEETGTQVTNGVNVKHHFYHPQKTRNFNQTDLKLQGQKLIKIEGLKTGKNKLVKIRRPRN